MQTAVSRLISSTSFEMLGILTDFVNENLELIVSLALAIGVVYLLFKLVGKF